MSGKYEPVSNKVPREISSLIEKMLSLNPTKRPSTKEILENSLINKELQNIFKCQNNLKQFSKNQ